MLAIVRILSVSMMLVITQPARALLDDYTFGPDDGLLVVDGQSKPIFAWQENKLLVPASLTKLISTQLAIQKWGLEHRFKTDFYLHGDQLWVKGYGDPFLISEELDLVAEALNKRGVSNQTVKSIYLDNSFYQISHVPGRSLVADPYNAPLSAISANFNTVNLRKVKGLLQSAEPQTPLTPTARRLASEMKTHDERVNLVNANNAQQHFAEIISIKLGLNDPEIHLNQRMSAPLQPVYRHENTNALEHLLRGALKYSNNFIANQLFLNLAP